MQIKSVGDMGKINRRMNKNQTIGETKNRMYFTDNDTLQEQKHKKSG